MPGQAVLADVPVLCREPLSPRGICCNRTRDIIALPGPSRVPGAAGPTTNGPARVAVGMPAAAGPQSPGRARLDALVHETLVRA